MGLTGHNENKQHSYHGNSRKRREKGTESVCKAIMAENFLNLGREINIQIQEAQRIPNRLNPNSVIPGHIIIKFSKVRNKEF